MKRRHINLLTWRFRFYLILRERLTLWAMAWIAVCLIAMTMWQMKHGRVDGATNDLALMESRCTPLRAMQHANRKMEARLAELHSHQSLLARLDDQQVPYRLMGLVSHSARQCSGGLRVKTVAIDRIREQISQIKRVGNHGKPDAPKVQEVVVLRLNGIADDNLAISRFVAALRDSGVFEKVDLRSSVGARVEEARAHTFLVECRLIGAGPLVAHHASTSRHL